MFHKAFMCINIVILMTVTCSMFTWDKRWVIFKKWRTTRDCTYPCYERRETIFKRNNVDEVNRLKQMTNIISRVFLIFKTMSCSLETCLVNESDESFIIYWQFNLRTKKDIRSYFYFCHVCKPLNVLDKGQKTKLRAPR